MSNLTRRSFKQVHLPSLLGMLVLTLSLQPVLSGQTGCTDSNACNYDSDAGFTSGTINYSVYSNGGGCANNASEINVMTDESNGSTSLLSTGQANASLWLNWWTVSMLNNAGYSTPSAHWSWKIEGHFKASETGTYTFSIEGDDAVDLFMNGSFVAAHYGCHGISPAGTHTGTIALTAGESVSFVARGQENGGGEGMRVWWKSPSNQSWHQDWNEIGIESEDTSNCTYATTWYADADGDGLGDANDGQSACSQPSGYVSNSNDNCDDTSACNYDGTSGSSDAVLQSLATVSVPEYDSNDDGWSLVVYEQDAASGHVNGALRFLGYSFGSAGDDSFNLGPDLTDYDDEILIVNGSNYYLLTTSAPFFENTSSPNLEILTLETNDADLNAAVSNDGGAKFCRAAVYPNVKPGDTSWGIIPNGSTQRGCGCNSGGWSGYGVYYGGSIDQTNCGAQGGRFAGYKSNGQPKGGVSTGHSTKIYVRNSSNNNDCSYGTTWYADADGDGLGDASDSQSACTQPSGYVADNSDNCDDVTAYNYLDPANATCNTEFNCGDGMSFDGHHYGSVDIGSKCWFDENLQSTNYADGTAIPSGSSGWSTTTDGQYMSPSLGSADYGLLYNSFAVSAPQGLCPSGWTVPSDTVWQDLEIALGMDPEVADRGGWAGSAQNVGGQLKEAGLTYWNSPNSGGNNASGFSARAAGRKTTDGSQQWSGTNATFWTSSTSPAGWTPFGYVPLSRYLARDNQGIKREGAGHNYGYSVRCVREVIGCKDRDACNYDIAATVSDGSCAFETSWYADTDGDGLGDASDSQSACAQPSGYVADSSDNCEDTSACNYDDDANGNCTYTTAVAQNTSVQLDVNGSASVVAASLDNGSTGCGGIASYSLSQSTFGCSDIGTNNVTFTVTDGDGNTASTAITVTVTQTDTDGDGILDCDDLCSDNTAINYNLLPQEDCAFDCDGLDAPLVFSGLTLSSKASSPDVSDGQVNLSFSGGYGTKAAHFSGATPHTTGTHNFSLSASLSAVPQGHWSVYVTDEAGCEGRCDGCGNTNRVTLQVVVSHERCDDANYNGVQGCTNPDYSEYNASANTDDGSCATLLGCTDSAYLEYNSAAGADDGSCATAVVNGCTDPAYVEYDATANTDDGSCETLASSCSEVEMGGYTYSVMEIGDQCWFAENLRTKVYADGSAIPNYDGNGDWAGLSTGARCDYINAGSNVAIYGRLYNWYAVDDTRGLCPSGWHVPTDGEWTTLENYISSQGFNGTEGTALKSTTGWNSDGNGTDNFGFSALPGGLRLSWGDFAYAGSSGYWWSSSPSGGNAWARDLDANDLGINRYSDNPHNGFSVRCLRDAD